MMYRLRSNGGRFGRPVYIDKIGCLLFAFGRVSFVFALAEAGAVDRLC